MNFKVRSPAPHRAIVLTISAMTLALATNAMPSKADPVFPTYCREYSDLLKIYNDASVEVQCSDLVKSVIKNNNLPFREFSVRHSHVFSENAPIRKTIFSIAKHYSSENLEAFRWIDLADRDLNAQLIASGDIERALIYGNLISRFKRELIHQISAYHDDSESYYVIDEISEYFDIRSGLLKEDPVSKLVCLMRLDSFVVSVTKVLNSSTFVDCVRRERHDKQQPRN